MCHCSNEGLASQSIRVWYAVYRNIIKCAYTVYSDILKNVNSTEYSNSIGWQGYSSSSNIQKIGCKFCFFSYVSGQRSVRLWQTSQTRDECKPEQRACLLRLSQTRHQLLYDVRCVSIEMFECLFWGGFFFVKWNIFNCMF